MDVAYHPAAREELTGLPMGERVAMLHAIEKLQALGEQLPFPHCSAPAACTAMGATPPGRTKPMAGLLSPGWQRHDYWGDWPRCRAGRCWLSPGGCGSGATDCLHRGGTKGDMMAKRALVRAEDVLGDELRDPVLRARWERLALARAVAIWLARFRVARKLTQGELAARLGVSQTVVARLEAGEHVPKLETLLRLADALGMSLHMDITPAAQPEGAVDLPEGVGVERITTPAGSRLRIVAACGS